MVCWFSCHFLHTWWHLRVKVYDSVEVMGILGSGMWLFVFYWAKQGQVKHSCSVFYHRIIMAYMMLIFWTNSTPRLICSTSLVWSLPMWSSLILTVMFQNLLFFFLECGSDFGTYIGMNFLFFQEKTRQYEVKIY